VDVETATSVFTGSVLVTQLRLFLAHEVIVVCVVLDVSSIETIGRVRQ